MTHTNTDIPTLDKNLFTHLPSFVGLNKLRKQHAGQRVETSIIDNALHVCQEYLNSVEHCDIDITLETIPTLSEDQWKVFLRNYYLVIQ